MGDLAVALVDLARHAERRREARRSLRESVSTVVSEMLRHLRVGDETTFLLSEKNGNKEWVAYSVERITWPINRTEIAHVDEVNGGVFRAQVDHPKGAPTLVRYPEGYFSSVAGAVLLDVRSPYRDGEDEIPIVGRSVSLAPRENHYGESVTDSRRLYLAMDDDLVRFAEEAERMVAGFAESCGKEAGRFASAADAITKLTPR